MKKYLFIALAALGFAACAEKMDDNSPVQNGELEESYIAINLMAADVDTRAVTDDPYGNADQYGYEEGTTAERAIATAYFFFFDANGGAFNVNATADAPGGNVNHLSLNITDQNPAASNLPNVSDIKKAVLVLNTYKGIYPSQIVAVLNWTPDPNTAYDLDELHGALATIGDDTAGYVMSNSVYMDGAGNVVDAVPLTAANIKTTPEAAKAAPVDIYVERTAAKVVLTATGKVENTENIFTTQKTSDLLGSNSGTLAGAPNNVPVYVKLHGWELYNDYSTSTLLKNIKTDWDVATLGLTWNDIPYFRCYWADSQNTPHSDSFSWTYDNATKTSKGFQTNYGFNVASAAGYADRTTYTYCGENTNQVTKSGEVITSDPRTKVILKGQLMQKNQDGTYSALELARWYGTEYAGRQALKIAVANSLKFTLFSSTDGEHFAGITPEDLECVAGTPGTKAYEVGFQLSSAGQEKTWYQYSSANGYQVLGALEKEVNKAKTNEYLATVESALLYAEGQTYYYIDIEHLGTAGAKYGVVRNHVYQIDVKSIKGYGSPVYMGTSNIVTPPEYPKDEEASYVAARINVLSWKVVKQQVNVGQ